MKEKKRHILVMSSWLPTAENPFLGNFVLQHIHALQSKYEITLIQVLESGKSGVESLHLPGIIVFTSDYHRSKMPLMTQLNKRAALRNVLSKVRDVDVIQAHVSYPDGWQFSLAKKVLKKPLVLVEHGSYFGMHYQWFAKMRYTVQKAIFSADKIVAVSTFLKRDMVKRFPSVEIDVLHNPVLLKPMNESWVKNADFTFLHVSTLDAIKNFSPILQAFSHHLIQFPKHQLVVVTDGDISKALLEVNKLNINNSVVFRQSVKHEDMGQFYAQAHCLVMNSEYETFSIVMAEAMQFGLPIISTPVGIAHEFTAENGIVTDGSTVEIERAMQQMVESYDGYDQKIIQNAGNEFDIDAYLAGWNRILSKLASK